MDELGNWTGPLHVVALALALSGGHKLADPAGASRAMRAAGIPPGLARGRVLGGLELVAGSGAVAFGGALLAVPVAVLYGAFGAFLLVLRRREPATPCGCFGASEAPPGPVHVAVDAAAAVLALGAAAGGAPGFPDVVVAATVPEVLAYTLLVLTGTAILTFGVDAAEQTRANAREVGLR